MKNLILITALVFASFNVQAAPAILGKWSADFNYLNNTYSMTLEITEKQTVASIECSDGSKTLSNSLTATSRVTKDTYTVLESKTNLLIEGKLDCSLSLDGVESTYTVEDDSLTLVTNGQVSILKRVK